MVPNSKSLMWPRKHQRILRGARRGCNALRTQRNPFPSGGKGQEKSSMIWLKSSSSDDMKYTLYLLTRLRQRKLWKVLMPKSVLPILFPKSCVFLLGTVDSTHSSRLRWILFTNTIRAWSSRKGLAWGHLCADEILCEKQYPGLMQECRLFP